MTSILKKLKWTKPPTIVISYLPWVLWVRKLGMVWLSSPTVMVRRQLRLQSPEGLTLAEGSASRAAHSLGGGVVWLLVGSLSSPPGGSLSILTAWGVASSSLQWESSKRPRQKLQSLSESSLGSDTLSALLYFIVTQASHVSMRKGATRGYEYLERNPWCRPPHRAAKCNWWSALGL